ncbi:MAG: hypothetical protein AAF676_18430 [Pseudomonadota bacterium]
MPATIFTSISADEICDQLTDDGNFAEEFWSEVADRLDAGALMDTTLDVLDANERGRQVVGMLARLVERAKDRMDDEG